MLASVILDKAARLLQDESHVRWSEGVLLDYLNQGRRECVKTLPGQFLETRTVQLVAGKRQTVPSDTAWFFGVVRNMGSDGTTIGAHVRKVDRNALESFTPSWAKKTGRTVLEYAQDDPREPTYLVNPPVPSTPNVHVEVELAAFPAALASPSNDIVLSDRFEPALIYYVLHMAMAQETEVGDATKAAAYLTAHKAALGT